MKDIHLNEEELIDRSKSDLQSFEPLYEKYYPQILKFVYKRMDGIDDAYEVVSIIFSKAMANIGKYKHKGFPFSSWLYRIAINEINMFYRESNKRRTISIEEISVRNLHESLGAECQELNDILKSALNHLNENEIQLIDLRFFENLPFLEIANMLGISENNAKVKTYRVLDRLRVVFQKLS
ncbi:MAG: sigma-70 family RNA polymerase sigma factor [Bacteroidota bacterium]